MNCPSRTDDDELHPGWNQNPPRFASDLTTCQDMNGMANARELLDGRGSGSTGTGAGDGDLGGFSRETRPPDRQPATGAGGPQQGPCTHCKESNVNIADRVWIYSSNIQSSAPATTPTPPSLWSGWAMWLLSVLFTSLVISNVNSSIVLGAMSWVKSIFKATPTPDVPQMVDPFVKRGLCASSGAIKNYNVPFHVGGLFIILFVSTTACAFPILVIKFPRLRIPASFLFSAKHFGTGVLIATAFVHLLPTAFISLGDPCLSSFWTSDYPAMPGAIALTGIFFVTIVEMIFSPAQHACGGGEKSVHAVSRTEHGAGSKNSPGHAMIRPSGLDSSQMRNLGPLQGRKTSISRTLSWMEEENQRLDGIETSANRTNVALQNVALKTDTGDAPEDTERNQHAGSAELSAEQMHKKAVLQCLLLEMGILFHSIFIGMSLSVSVGSEFVILLIAIIFHQTFEGLALGVRIATIQWPKNSIQPWLMALAYGCTTPLGQAIGIATHTLYTPDSEIGLLVVGVMNAISAGLLVFASLVELLSEDFLSDESWQVLKGKRRIYACVLVFLGAFFMSLVGAWA